jgi:hypothetical protein
MAPIAQRLFTGALALLLVLAVPSGLQAQAPENSTAQLLDWLDSMNAEAQRLEDLLAIQRLQRAYGYYIDKGYWNEAADLFTSSSTLEVGVDGVYIGKDRVRDMLIRYGEGSPDAGPGLPFGKMNRHMQLQPVVTIGTDGNTAQARWRNLSMLGEYMKAVYWGDSILENTYRKENGVWKIQSLHLYPNFVAPYRGGWAALKEAAADWTSPVARDNPPDSPPTFTYRPFPELYTAPFHYGAPETRAARESWVTRLGDIGTGSDELAGFERDLLEQARALDNLAAERDIENLQAIYGYYIDKGLWDEATALFANTATYEFGQGGVYVGRARIREAIGLMGPTGLERGMLNNYPMLQPIISVAADNQTAKARWRSDVQLSRNGKGTWGGGVYENEYVNENGVWKLGKLHYYVTFWADYDKGWVDGTIPMEGPSPILEPDLPPTEVYGAQPEVYLFPFHYPHLVTGKAHIGKGDAAGTGEAR